MEETSTTSIGTIIDTISMEETSTISIGPSMEETSTTSIGTSSAPDSSTGLWDEWGDDDEEPAAVTVAVQRLTVGAPNAAGPDMVWPVAGPPLTNVPLIAATRANIVDVLPPRAPGGGAPQRHNLQPPRGVPQDMQQDDDTAWLTAVRCCRFQRTCPLCRHRRRAVGRAAAGQGAWLECTICVTRVPPTAMVACATCDRAERPMCVMCILRSMAAKRYENRPQALDMERCAFCREPKSRNEIYAITKYYRKHRHQIRDFVPRLFLTDGDD